MDMLFLEELTMTKTTSTILLAAYFLAPAIARPQPFTGTPTLYVLAATPTTDRPVTFPATLYKVNAVGALRMVRELASGNDGVDFVLSDSNALVVASPHIAPSHLQIVHFEDPGNADAVKIDVGDSLVSTQIVRVPGQGPTVVLEHETNSEPFSTGLLGISLSESSVPRVTAALNPAVMAGILFEGLTGGTERSRRAKLSSLTAEGLRFYQSGEKRWINMRGAIAKGLPLQLPRSRQGEDTPHTLAILKCIDDQFAIFSVNLQVFIQDLNTGEVRQMSAINAYSHLRIFDSGQTSWLAAVVAEPNPGNQRVNPGADNQRTLLNQPRHLNSSAPPVREFYVENINEEWFPGILELTNLQTKSTVQIKTGQADSEILRVSGNTVLYRVNRQIWQANLTDGKLDIGHVIVEDDAIPEVHWAFWSAD